jgi:hypothetical protein
LFVAAATSAFAAAGLTAIARSPISAAASGTPAYVKGALRSGISDDSPGMGHIGIFAAHACATDGKSPSVIPYAFSLTKEPVPMTTPAVTASP